MIRNIIKISKGERLSDVMTEIPTNAVLHKVLTGIGATHLEINTARNSIIIEPNVPVIKGKVKSNKTKILGVREGIYVPDIEAYLMNNTILHKKIMTTPESFQKIKEAMARLDIDMYKDYFLMYDECERTTTDVDFRQDIILPLEDFFMFEKKAFVSATALMPSDPRFSEQDFEVYEIVPTFDFAKPLNTVATDNPLMALEKSFKEFIPVKEGDKVYIFFNSIMGIMSVIERANLSGRCAIFCSDDGRKKIKDNKGIKIYDHIDENKFETFNFFTSRFYSAVDIHVSEKPHVVVMTDLNVAHHTMIDPRSELIQIAGRFRNIELASLTFIANHDRQLYYRSREEARAYLDGCAEIYRTLQSLRDVSTNEGASETLGEALQHVSYARFLTKKEEKNYFMIDNYFQKEELKKLYAHKMTWKDVFLERDLTLQFKVTHYDYNFGKPSFYPKVKGVYNYIDIVKRIVAFLDNIFENESDEIYTVFSRDSALKELIKNYENIVEAYRVLGGETLCNVGYSKNHIAIAMQEYRQSEGVMSNYDFLSELDKSFNVGEFYGEKSISTRFRSLINKYSLPYTNKRKFMNDFNRFYELSGRTSRRKEKGYVIKEKKFI